MGSPQSEGNPPLILHIINGFEMGGTERVLLRFLQQLPDYGFENGVLALQASGSLTADFLALQVPIFEWHLRDRMIGSLMRLPRLWHFVSDLRPTLIHGWMYHANLVAAGLAKILDVPLVWSIRHSVQDIRLERRLTRLSIRCGARLSGLPSKILYNSSAAASRHEELGYRNRRRGLMIPNGFDGTHFTPSPERRARLRRRVGVDESTVLIGLVTRFHSCKGFDLFFEAAERVCRDLPGVQFVVAGRDVNSSNRALADLIGRHHLEALVHVLGEVADSRDVLCGLDVLCSPSRSDSFPNIVGEAMCCGVPCVVTDLGEVGNVVADAGIVVPRENPAALANAWKRMLYLGGSGRLEIGLRARRRILQNYGWATFVSRSLDVYSSELRNSSRGGRGGSVT